MSNTPGTSNKVLPIVLALLLVAAVVFAVVTNGQKADLDKKVKELTGKVTTLEGELTASQSAIQQASDWLAGQASITEPGATPQAALPTQQVVKATAAPLATTVPQVTAKATAAPLATTVPQVTAKATAAPLATTVPQATAKATAAAALATMAPQATAQATAAAALATMAPQATAKAAVTAPAGKVNFSVFQLKVEIDPMIQAFAKLYNEKNPGVNVTVETLGGGADYGGALKAKLSADQMPTIFMIEGKGGYELWKDYIADQSAAAWVKDTDLAYYSPEKKAVGFPIAMEGFGLGYNADILAKAGIDPATLTTFSAVKAAFVKLESMKAELGLTSVTSVGTSVAGGLWWVTSQHVFNAFYAGYLNYNDSSVYDALMKGEVDQVRLTAFANYLKLLYDYADPNVLKNGNYDAQVAAFATGKAAFITQGNWIDPNLKQLGATFKMGYISHNFLEQESKGLFMAAPSWFVVNAKATPEQQKAAIDFLNYMALSEDGANYMVKEAGMVPAFKSVKLLPTGPFSKALVEASARGGNYNWYFGKNPDGFNQGTLGPIFELLATDGNVESFVADVTAAFKSIVK